MLKWLKTQKRRRVIRGTFGTTHPETVRIIEGEHALHVDPRDERATKILLYDTARGRRRANQAFWFEAVAAFEPTIALDIGLNYGECLLSIAHPGVRELHGFEANPALMPFIDRTVAGHPDRERITIHNRAVSSESGQTVHLAVNENWSGGSHLAETGVAVETVAIDEAVEVCMSDRLLFKIDVEGFEPPVVDGMLASLDSAASSLGFVEFSADLMAGRGQDVAAYWEVLRSRFAIAVCDGIGEAKPLADEPWERQPLHRQRRHCDLILVGKANADCAYAARFLDGWRSRTIARRAA